jgi:hypothetical protein
MKPGDTFILPDAFGKHLNAVLLILNDGSIVHCHFTTLTRRSDSTCVLNPGEHSFFKVETCVRYDQAQICLAGPQLDALERLIEMRFEPLSDELLKRVKQGALDSPQTPDKIKSVLKGK